MKVWGIATVKDEADVITGTLRHLAEEGLDHLLVLDNGSSDGTRDILSDLTSELPLTVIDDDEVGYYQSRRMSRLAEMAAESGTCWIVPFDADEVWVFRGDRIGAELRACHADVVTAQLFQQFPSAFDPPEADAFRRIQWRLPDVAPLPKVAFRWRPGAVIHQGNHGVTLAHSAISVTGLEVRHFPYRTVEQFISKVRNGAAAYAATDLPDSAGAHWRGYGRILESQGEDGLRAVFERYFFALSPADEGWVLDPAPYMRWSE